jgi:hypothetical protein
MRAQSNTSVTNAADLQAMILDLDRGWEMKQLASLVAHASSEKKTELANCNYKALKWRGAN